MLKTGKIKDKDPSDLIAASAGKVNVVAQELKFAKMLASNDVKTRNGVLKSLKKWLNTRSQSSYRKYLLITFALVTTFSTFLWKNVIQLGKNVNSLTVIKFTPLA